MKVCSTDSLPFCVAEWGVVVLFTVFVCAVVIGAVGFALGIIRGFK